MRSFDFSSWQAVLSTLLGLAIITLLGVGIRLLVMQTVQQRRERENRQINERLRTLIAAYKTLGGSFTGDLAVDPTHLRDARRRPPPAADATAVTGPESTDRTRRIRDAVEAALSDVVLLGTDEQVRLAARAATELAEGRPIHTADLVISLRNPFPGGGRHSTGNRMAIVNIRERLQLHFDAEASMRSEVKDGFYRVTIRIPYLTAAP